MNILLWQVNGGFAPLCVEEENLYEIAYLSSGRLFHDDAITFVKVGLLSQSTSVWILFTVSVAAAVKLGVSYLFLCMYLCIYLLEIYETWFVWIHLRPAALE